MHRKSLKWKPTDGTILKLLILQPMKCSKSLYPFEGAQLGDNIDGKPSGDSLRTTKTVCILPQPHRLTLVIAMQSGNQDDAVDQI